jgi:hypothetical protein
MGRTLSLVTALSFACLSCKRAPPPTAKCPHRASGARRSVRLVSRIQRDPSRQGPQHALSSPILNLSRPKSIQLDGGNSKSIRHTKSLRFGFGLEYSKSNSTARMEVLLILVALAALALRLVGLTRKAKGPNYQLRANTLRKQNVLSTSFLWRLLPSRGMMRHSEQFARIRDGNDIGTGMSLWGSISEPLNLTPGSHGGRFD